MDRTTPASSSADPEAAAPEELTLDSVDIYVPTSWAELTPAQYRAAVQLKSTWPRDEARVYAFLAFAGIQLVSREQGTTALVRLHGKPYRVTLSSIMLGAREVGFIDNPPEFPLRYDEVEGHAAPDAELHGVPFGTYLQADAAFARFLLTRSDAHALQLIELLYGADVAESPRRAEYIYMATQWWTGLKTYLARLFRHIFRPAASKEGEEGQPAQPDEEEIRDLTLAQIRALTDGDVTKEEAVLNVDTWSALAELDAKARDAAEIRRLYSK